MVSWMKLLEVYKNYWLKENMKTNNKKSMDKIKVMIEEGNVMKKEMSLICVLLLAVSSFVFGAGGVLPGSGTGFDPYLIEDMADFDVFADGANAETYWDASVKLMCDIDLGGRVYDNAVIAPYLDNEIDSSNVVAYSGFFEGDGHVISGLVIDTEGEVAKSVGLFGKINEGEVRNLSVADVSIIAEASMYVGGLCGEFEKSYIYCCNVTGTVRGGGDVRDSYHYDQSSTGGVFGCVVYGTSYIRYCWSECNVDGAVNVGGFCGSNSGVIYACYAKGRVNNYLESETQYGITGGYCGLNAGIITDCYCVGEVLINGSVGGKGFCCWNESENINNCFWNIEVSSVYNSDGGYGRLTSQMKEMSTYTDNGWHFINVPEAGNGGVWVMEDYPKNFFKYYGLPSVFVPGIEGDLPADAESELEQFGLSVGDIIYEYSNDIAEGRIIRTIPEGRAIVEEGAEIDLVVSKGSCPVVPIIVYKEKAEAAAAIINSGFVVGDICESYNWIYDAGEVIGQKPESGSFLLPGGEVSIMVSLGKPSHLEGAGTKDDPYLMKNSGDFFRFTDKGFADKYCAAGVYTRLECDLNLSYMEYDDAVIPNFYGVFDGNGHVIRNLRIVSAGDYLGLFGKVDGENAKVCNLGLEDVEIIFRKNSEYVGALCGRAARSEISGCYSTGIIECDSFYMYDDNFESLYIGGLCGSLVGDGKVYDTFSSCEILANNSRWVGGLIGSINNGEVVHCYATGNVDGRYNSGGFVGGSFYGIGEIRYCYATGDVEGVEGVGGFCGWDEGDIHIEYCYARGDVFGGESVGGFCGYGTASNSCALGSVLGDENVGGFAGYGGGTNSCARGRVIGNQNVGSFCGTAEGDVINCYSTGELLGHRMIYSGGQMINLVFRGKSEGSYIENCFWDVETTGVGEPGDTLGEVKGVSTAQMKTKQTFVDAGWDFEYERSDNDFETFIAPGWCMIDGDYPQSQWLFALESLGGRGSEREPFRIENVEDFEKYTENKLYCHENIYTLVTCDLDLTGKTFVNSPVAPQFVIVGEYNYVELPFAGVFDGGGHVIRNLTILSDQYNGLLDMGMFGRMYGENARVENLGLENLTMVFRNMKGYISDPMRYGGICGENQFGTIRNCYTTGNISSEAAFPYSYDADAGIATMGGICGNNIEGVIDSCYSSCNIFPYGGAGLCAMNTGGIIRNCYATGDITGGGAGLCTRSINYNSASSRLVSPLIENCYATGVVTGDHTVAGLCAVAVEGSVVNSYWDVESSGVTVSAGGVGKTTAEMQDAGMYISAGWDFEGEAVNGSADIWHMPVGGYPRFAWQIGVPDINDDGVVDLFDFSAMSSSWMSGESSDGFLRRADLNGSGLIDLQDLEMFMMEWLVGDIVENIVSSVGYWKLDEADGGVVVDYSGCRNDGVVHGDPTRENGKVDGCYVFDGAEDYVEIVGYAGIGGSSARTVAAWIKADEDLADDEKELHMIMSWGVMETGKKWMFMLDNNTGMLAIANYGARVKGGTDLEDGLWHHVAAVLPEGADNMNQVKLYVDGMEIVTNAASADLEVDTSVSENVLIGARDIDSEFGIQTPDGFFKGAIDEVRIYNAALSDEEIAELAR